MMSDSHDLIEVAEALGIPWKRLLETEIHVERELRRTLGEASDEAPLWRVFSALPLSVLDSWRVRERIRELSWAARTGSSTRAARDLRALADHLSGKASASDRSSDPLLRHFEFAHQRVLELQRLARSAEKSRGDLDARVRHVVQKTGCFEPDARWAVERALAPRHRTVIEDAMGRARGEGFEIPRAATEFQAWVLLRRFVRDSARKTSRRAARAAERDRAAWDPPRSPSIPLLFLSTPSR
jgi:hypothetical protein